MAYCKGSESAGRHGAFIWLIARHLHQQALGHLPSLSPALCSLQVLNPTISRHGPTLLFLLRSMRLNRCPESHLFQSLLCGPLNIPGSGGPDSLPRHPEPPVVFPTLWMSGRDLCTRQPFQNPSSFPLHEASGPCRSPQTPTPATNRNFCLHLTNEESPSFPPMPGGLMGHQDDWPSVSFLSTCSEHRYRAQG